MTERAIGDLDEVLDNLGVFRSLPDDLIAPCPSGFRRIPISRGEGYYLSLQALGPDQVAYAHTHADSEEWVVVLKGDGQAKFAETPVELSPGVVVGRGGGPPPRVRERGRGPDAPVDPDPPPEGGPDHVGRAGDDHRPGAVPVGRDLPPVPPVRGPLAAHAPRPVLLRELRPGVLTARPRTR